MARARNIKPGFFKNEELVELSFGTRLLFIGLWTEADRAGRLEDKPKRIKMNLFPADDIDIDAGLNELQARGFVVRYEHGGARYIQVLAFDKHQNPHKDEKGSTIPAMDEPEASTVQAPCKPEVSTVAIGLIPDSLIPDPLIPDSLIPDSKTLAPTPAGDEPPPVKAEKPKKPPKEQPPTADAWGAYAHAYQMRYGEPPVRNAKVNGQLAQFVSRVGAHEAPDIARFYVGHQGMYYVRNMHPIDALLKDAEKLRTEWATGRKVTNTQAQQADRTATNHDAFAPLIEAARRAEEAI